MFFASCDARGRFFVATRRFAGRTATHGDSLYQALEHDTAATHADGVARFDDMRGLDASAVEVNLAARDRVRRRRSRLEESNREQPAINSQRDHTGITVVYFNCESAKLDDAVATLACPSRSFIRNRSYSVTSLTTIRSR